MKILWFAGRARLCINLRNHLSQLEMAPHAIGELVSTALADCKRVSRVRPIHGGVKHKDLQVLADLPWARSVLVQLIVNAHLYSWPGQATTVSSERKGGFALLSVADQRPGIEKTEAARIFEEFYRCKDQKIRANDTGMGLPIAKSIVEAHGGTIDVVSRFGYGSVFTSAGDWTHVARLARSCHDVREAPARLFCAQGLLTVSLRATV